MKSPEPTPKESAKFAELATIMNAIGDAFANDDADPYLLREAANVVREAADALDAYALRWEMSRVLGQ